MWQRKDVIAQHLLGNNKKLKQRCANENRPLSGRLFTVPVHSTHATASLNVTDPEYGIQIHLCSSSQKAAP